jgi:hypothetical protein
MTLILLSFIAAWSIINRDRRDRDGSAAADNDPERVVAEPVGRRLEHVWHPASHQLGIVTMANSKIPKDE